jgi:hypothetical protein
VKLSSLAALTALIGAAALPHAASAANFALSSDGASFVSGSSYIPQGSFGLTMNYSQMQANLLTNTPSPSISNGDTRYIFDGGDPNATVIIDLGQVRQIRSLGANLTLPASNDRTVVGPFTAEVSTDGSTYTPFPGSLTVDGSTVNPATLNGPLESVRYIAYHFGPSPTYYGAGGVGIGRLFASVPEPGSWALMICGVGLAGVALRRRRSPANAAANA